MKMKFLSFVVLGALGGIGTAEAVPVLQVGAPAGAGDTGIYADYQSSLSNPTEEDTAVTSGSTIFVAGVYQNKNILNLGGQFGTGANWTEVEASLPAVFDSHGAVLVAAIPNGSLANAVSSLTVDGAFAFYSSDTLSGLFPNNHDPLKDAVSDFLFFDIGEFTKTAKAVSDFAADPDNNATADGEIKQLTIAGFAGLEWIHFDVMALETTENGSKIKTSWEVNPGSHDLTFKNPGFPPPPPPDVVPEPGILSLLAIGLLGMRVKTGRKSV
jgi:hypothetical protein